MPSLDFFFDLVNFCFSILPSCFFCFQRLNAVSRVHPMQGPRSLNISYTDGKNESRTPANRKCPTGDRVALENGIPCSQPTCTACRTGRYHGCPDMTFFSSPPVDGTLRRYHAHPAAWLHKLPDSMTFGEGAMLEPLSVALAGIERAGLRLGDPLVICGAGPIGLVSLLAAHAAGAAPIVITDLNESRLEMAKRLVPRVRAVKVESGVRPEEMAERIKRALSQEAGLVLECTGVESSIHSAIYVSEMKKNRVVGKLLVS